MLFVGDRSLKLNRVALKIISTLDFANTCRLAKPKGPLGLMPDKIWAMQLSITLLLLSFLSIDGRLSEMLQLAISFVPFVHQSGSNKIFSSLQARFSHQLLPTKYFYESWTTILLYQKLELGQKTQKLSLVFNLDPQLCSWNNILYILEIYLLWSIFA